MSSHKEVLIVGAGFSGAVYAHVLAAAGYKIHVIDKRPHVGGNAYDFVDENGVRVHAYGPHLFHTKNKKVIEWIEQFGTFVPYTHKVRAKLPDGRMVPIPINLDTVNALFSTHFDTPEQVEMHLAKIAIPIANPTNAAEYLYSKIGRDLTDLFFRPYTKKMWSHDLEDTSIAVVKRIPLRFDRTDTYFPDDDIQLMPRDGYTSLFERLFAQPGIRVSLNTRFVSAMLEGVCHCFNAMPIDEYYEFQFGDLPYRSIRFHNRTEVAGPVPDWSVTNFTDIGPFTRETNWDALPHHRVLSTGRRTLTKEEPCDYRDNNMERYYPVKTADGRYQDLYESYKKLAEAEPKMSFIGRCGTYQYLDMDQVISQSLAGAERWLQANSSQRGR
jgi:UDP-galactopyranose mutase